MKVADIQYALAHRARARQECYFSELNTDSGGKKFRFDGWLIKPSFKGLYTTGFEIKINRSDFVSDEKYIAYLPYCNSFYFVCPAKDPIISKEEVPDEAGLLYICSDHSVKTMKKAKYREIQLCTDFLLGLIINRLSDRRGEAGREQRIDDLLRLAKKEKDAFEIGRQISSAISRQYYDYKIEVRKHERQVKQFEAVTKFLEDSGIDINTLRSHTDFVKQLEYKSREQMDKIRPYTLQYREKIRATRDRLWNMEAALLQAKEAFEGLSFFNEQLIEKEDQLT